MRAAAPLLHAHATPLLPPHRGPKTLSTAEAAARIAQLEAQLASQRKEHKARKKIVAREHAAALQQVELAVKEAVAREQAAREQLVREQRRHAETLARENMLREQLTREHKRRHERTAPPRQQEESKTPPSGSPGGTDGSSSSSSSAGSCSEDHINTDRVSKLRSVRDMEATLAKQGWLEDPCRGGGHRVFFRVCGQVRQTMTLAATSSDVRFLRNVRANMNRMNAELL